MLGQLKIKDLEKQGYRIVGNHSAIKVCDWTKKAILCKDTCYKNTFYGIQSHRCVQMTPSLHTCPHRCIWCWRDIEFTESIWNGPVDEPKTIVTGCIEAHRKYLMGFGGNPASDPQKYKEALAPKHFAISLSGEPTSYPKLPELIEEIHKHNLTSFLVTNGSNPEMLASLINHQPTQLYITLPAPDEKTYIKSCRPLVPGTWENIQKSLQLLKQFSCRKAIRLTLVKGFNMANPKGYADLINQADADFFEFKAYMWVGYSKLRLPVQAMPSHEEILKFAEEVGNLCGLKKVDEKINSRVVLMMRNSSKLLKNHKII